MLHLGKPWRYQQTFDKVSKACQGQHSNLSQTFINYGRKKFYNIGPWSKGLSSTCEWSTQFRLQTRVKVSDSENALAYYQKF